MLSVYSSLTLRKPLSPLILKSERTTAARGPLMAREVRHATKNLRGISPVESPTRLCQIVVIRRLTADNHQSRFIIMMQQIYTVSKAEKKGDMHFATSTLLFAHRSQKHLLIYLQEVARGRGRFFCTFGSERSFIFLGSKDDAKETSTDLLHLAHWKT